MAKTPLYSQSVSLNGTEQGSISQNIRTTPGTRVTIAGFQAADPWCQPPTRQSYTAAATPPQAHAHRTGPHAAEDAFWGR